MIAPSRLAEITQLRVWAEQRYQAATQERYTPMRACKRCGFSYTPQNKTGLCFDCRPRR